jgi:hypothetical protein
LNRFQNSLAVYWTVTGQAIDIFLPRLMIAAIEDVVQAVRDPSSWATPAADIASP